MSLSSSCDEYRVSIPFQFLEWMLTLCRCFRYRLHVSPPSLRVAVSFGCRHTYDRQSFCHFTVLTHAYSHPRMLTSSLFPFFITNFVLTTMPCSTSGPADERVSTRIGNPKNLRAQRNLPSDTFDSTGDLPYHTTTNTAINSGTLCTGTTLSTGANGVHVLMDTFSPSCVLNFIFSDSSLNHLWQYRRWQGGLPPEHNLHAVAPRSWLARK